MSDWSAKGDTRADGRWANFLHNRLLLLSTLRTVSRKLLAASLFLQLVRALVPAGSAAVTARFVDTTVRAANGNIWGPALALSAFGAVLFMGWAAQELLGPVNFLIAQSVDGAQRAELTGLAAASSTIGILEQLHVQELLRLARADPDTWDERTPGQGGLAQLSLVFRYLGLGAACVVLGNFSWWLVPLILLPSLTVRSIWRRQLTEHRRTQLIGVSEGLQAEDWKHLATHATDGKEVRTYGLAEWAISRLIRHRLTMLKPRWASEIRTNRAQWKVAVLIAPSFIIGYVLVALNTVHGGNSVGMATATIGASWAVVQLIDASDVMDIEGSLPAIKAMSELRSEFAPEAVPASSEAKIRSIKGVVRFEGVSFSYPGMTTPLLDGLDLEIRPSELLAIVGLNGAGKSTLIKLLAGLYKPLSGRITVDGIDIEKVGMRNWRRHISVVFQDFVRYPLSAYDNVVFGEPSAAPAEWAVRAAANASGLEKVIERLTDGWATPLSRSRTGGVDLSGGQWQQVVLARALYALYRGAWLLAMDEPTAHLDVSTEFQVFRQLAAHRGDASVLLISHRLSTVRQADRIVLLEAGRIVEMGTHDDLMATKGTYAKLFAIQAERFNIKFTEQADLSGGQQ